MCDDASDLSDNLHAEHFKCHMFSNQPLADRLRPRSLDEFAGQEHLVGSDGVLRKVIESGNVPSFILWGPPGVGKTYLVAQPATHRGYTDPKRGGNYYTGRRRVVK